MGIKPSIMHIKSVMENRCFKDNEYAIYMVCGYNYMKFPIHLCKLLMNISMDRLISKHTYRANGQ